MGFYAQNILHLQVSCSSPVSSTHLPFQTKNVWLQVEEEDYEDEHENDDVDTSVDANDKKDLTWTNDIDDYLMDLLIDQMHKGQKIGSAFTKAAYSPVLNEISKQFRIACSRDQVKNRLKTLRKTHSTAQAILQASGFGFNASTQ